MATSEKATTPPAGDWIEAAQDALASAGHRTSAPRSAVLAVIARQDCVLSAAEISDRLRANDQGIGLATVYRTLDLLESLGLLQRLDMGDQSTRYEPLLPGGDHHHHVICDRCGEVKPFDDPGLERSIERIGDRLDYEIAGHDVVLRGRCPGCAAA